MENNCIYFIKGVTYLEYPVFCAVAQSISLRKMRFYAQLRLCKVGYLQCVVKIASMQMCRKNFSEMCSSVQTNLMCILLRNVCTC